MKLNVEVAADVEKWLSGKAHELEISTETFAASILEEAMLRDAETLSGEDLELLAGDVVDIVDDEDSTKNSTPK